MKLLKTKIGLGIIAVVLLGIGFFAGMEFKAYQIRKAFQTAFNPTQESNSTDTALEQAKKDNYIIIDKTIGDEITLTLGKIKVTSVRESQTLTSKYGTPRTAKNEAKFVIVGLDVTNITNSSYSFPVDEAIGLSDSKGREFTTYSESIGSIDDYLNYRELAPSVTESGFVVYEIPLDSDSYSLITSKQ